LEALNFFAYRSAGFLHGGGVQGTRHLLSRLQLSGTERILEVGVGTGATLVALKSIWPKLRLSALDINPMMLKQARKRLQFCQVSDVELLQVEKGVPYPFEPHSFDLVLVESVLAIQSLPDLKWMLGQFKQVLKPGGRLACNETLWLPGQSPEALAQFNDQCVDYFGIIQSNDALPDVQAWKSFFVKEGWEVDYCEPIEKYSGTLSFGWKHYLSQSYTKWNAWKVRLNQDYRQQMKWMEQKERELFPAGTPKLNAYLFICHSDLL